MNLRILVPLVGANFSFSAGDITEASESNASRLIAAGFAEPVADADEIETADASNGSVEQATVKTTKSRTSKAK